MISNNFTFYQSAIGALRSGVGALAGAPLQVAGRSATRSAAPDCCPERYSERRSGFCRSANTLHLNKLFTLIQMCFMVLFEVLS